MLLIDPVLRHAERRFGLLTHEDLLVAGVSSRQISRWVDDGRLVALHRGVFRVGGAPPSPEGSILAAILVHGEGTWAAYRSAAALWALPGHPHGGRIELLREIGVSHQRLGARVHRSRAIPAHHVTTHRGIPVTTLSRTVADLAGVIGPARLDRLVEEALRTRWCTVGSLFRVHHDLAGRGRPGTRRLREVLARRGEGYVPTESELDVLGRAAVRQVPGIEWQVQMFDEQGYIRRVDGLHRDGGVVIEWDGADFHDAAHQRAADQAGDERLAALGLEVVRYRWPDVTVRAADTALTLGRLVRQRAGAPS